MFRQPPKRGFTLVELVIVIAVIGILVTMLFPALQTMRQTCRHTKCSVNLRQVAQATIDYETSHQHYPRGDDGRGGSFFISLLAPLKQEYLNGLAQQDLGEKAYQERLLELSAFEVAPLICPAAYVSDISANVDGTGQFSTHYYGVAGPVAQGGETNNDYACLTSTSAGPIGLQGVFSPDVDGSFERGKTQCQITDGTSNTFGVGEIAHIDATDNFGQIKRAGWAFGAGYDDGRVAETFAMKSIAFGINQSGGSLNDQPFSSNHPGGAQFATLDGAVHFVSDQVELKVLKSLSSIDAQEETESLVQF